MHGSIKPFQAHCAEYFISESRKSRTCSFETCTGCAFSRAQELLAWAKAEGNPNLRAQCGRNMRRTPWHSAVGKAPDGGVFWPMRSGDTDRTCLRFLPLFQLSITHNFCD